MNAKAKNDLADIFNQIDRGAIALDEVAGRILTAIREAGATTLDAFNDMTAAAFDKNGWSRRVGRPEPGDVPAPSAVKVYVSTIRAAYRLSVAVADFDSISALRKAVKEASAGLSAHSSEHHGAPEMKGVKVDKPGALTGSLWHDAIVLWENLPESQQHKLEEAVRKLVERFTAKAPPAILRLVA